MDNEDEGHRLLGEFFSYFGSLAFFVPRLMGILYEKNAGSSKEILEKAFNEVSQKNLESGKSDKNHETLEKTIEKNKGDSNLNLGGIIWGHLYFTQCIECFRKQLNSLEIDSDDKIALNEILNELHDINRLRNDLSHGGVVFQEGRKGFGVCKLIYSSDGTLSQKEMTGFIDIEIQNIKSLGQELSRIFGKYKFF